ncbi:tetratricopeptide repeat protein [Nevskia ramosa]|uniref:tetratricopeptide repeat protein n=1 Tax=Nevskia ramosa TaxID=64002 RepID=UPI003D0E6093
MSASNFVAELQRRNVHRAALFYAGAAWLLVQIATQVFPFFEIPNSTVRIVVIAVVIGFPFAMLFSWFYEWTPQGIKLESEIDRSESVTRQTGKALDRWIIAVLALAVVVLLANAMLGSHSEPVERDRSIAVLPFANTSGDVSNEYFSDGLSEEMISSLSRLQSLKVIGRTSSFRFKGSTDSSQAIGSALGVVYLLEGSVRKSADRVRIAVALLKAADGANVWSETYDRDLKDIFSLQSEIAGAVANQLKLTLLGNNAQLVQAPTAATPSNHNVAAYTALLQGNYYANRQTQADYRKAVEFYDEAIRLDPEYALAYSELATAWSDLGSIWLGGAEARAAYDQSRAAAQTAVRLAPDLGQAHLTLGHLLFNDDMDLPAAGVEYQRAVALAPAEALPKAALGYWLAAHGRYEEALSSMRASLAIDPLHTETYVFYGRTLITLGRIDEADAAVRKGIELQPQAARLHGLAAEIALARGQTAQAVTEAHREGEGFWRDYAVTLALQKQPDRSAADAALQKFIAQYGDIGGSQIAIIYALRREPDAMFAWLDRGYASRDPGTVMLPFINPHMVAYKDDPRFIAYGRKTGLIPPAQAAP